jgi:glyoxylase-like metal-dependent hydrolase (beta-lactamase superfamily II)
MPREPAPVELLAEMGVARLPIPVPFAEAGGPANIYVIEEAGGGLALFDAGIGTSEGGAAIQAGFRALGRSLGEVRRIFVSHGHIDHYGFARAVQEASGAPVFCHARDHDKLSWRDREPIRVERYVDWLLKLGADETMRAGVEKHFEVVSRMSRPVERIEALEPGTRLEFAKFSAEVLHLPGHTPGLVCLWDSEHQVLFSDDHLLEVVSPNPNIDLEGGAAPVHRPLVEYLRSAKQVRELPARLIAPGHNSPFAGHVELIDRLLGFYEVRQQKMLDLLKPRPLTAMELAPLVFPRARPSIRFLILSEVVGNLEVLEDQGLVSRQEQNGRFLFAPVSAYV